MSRTAKQGGNIPGETQIRTQLKLHAASIEGSLRKITQRKKGMTFNGTLLQGIRITLWTGRKVKGGYASWPAARQAVVGDMKDVFYDFYLAAFGSGGTAKSYTGKGKKIAQSSQKGGYQSTRVNKNTGRVPSGGRDSFRQEFSLSHQAGSTEAQQGLVSLDDHAGNRAAVAQARANEQGTKNDFLQGRADGFKAVQTELAKLITPSLKSSI